MIKVKHLNKAFGSISVLRDLNLTVNGPLVLMGPSGCGKTTLLRILMGLETPDSGTVQGVGNIGAVFQESRLCPQLTAVGNICLVGGVNPAQAQAELQTLGFTQAELALPVARLSGGQQRRTALLRALYLPGGVGTAPALSRCGLLAFFFCTCLALPQAVWQGMNGVDTPVSFPLAITLGCTGLLGAACARNIARRG